MLSTISRVLRKLLILDLRSELSAGSMHLFHKYCEAVNYCQATKLWASKAPAQKIWSIYSANNFICFFSTNILHRMLNAIKIQHDRPRMVAPRCLWYLVHYCCNSNFHVHQKASLSPTKPCDVTERKNTMI